MSTNVYTVLNPFNFIRHHSSALMYHNLSAQRLSKRTAFPGL